MQVYWVNGAYAHVPGHYGQPGSQFPDGSSGCRPLTFVLLHGSWADASFWNGVAAELRRQGHIVHVPEYPGHGADPNTNVTHGQITQAVVDYIVQCDLKDVILVGHSFGGSVVQTTAERVPDRIRRLVFANALVLGKGQSPADQFPPDALQVFEQLRQASKDDTIMLPFNIFRETFVNLADLDLARRLYAEIRPEPAKPLFEKLKLDSFYELDIPRSYLYLTGDNVLPQGEGYGWHPHMSSRLGLFRLIEAQGDHMTYFRTAPAYVACKLYEASRD